MAARSLESDDVAVAVAAARFADFVEALLFAIFVALCFVDFFTLFIVFFFPAMYFLSFCQI